MLKCNIYGITVVQPTELKHIGNIFVTGLILCDIVASEPQHITV